MKKTSEFEIKITPKIIAGDIIVSQEVIDELKSISSAINDCVLRLENLKATSSSFEYQNPQEIS